MLLKLVDELPSETFPTQLSNFTGSITGLSKYQAIGFASVFDNGMEISIGFDKSIWNVLLINAFNGMDFTPNLLKKGPKQFRHIKTFLF